MRTPYNIKDETGMTYGLLTVMGQSESRGGHAAYVCLCACGSKIVVTGTNLRRGNTSSCGCLAREQSRVRRLVHGHTCGSNRSHTHAIWSGMVQRCGNLPLYRNIKVHPRWLSFESFLEDMGECPPGLSIDRFPDNTGDYTPGNCRWATQKQQQNNRTNNRLITIDGVVKTLAEWCEAKGIRYSRVWARIQVLGWSPEAALEIQL